MAAQAEASSNTTPAIPNPSLVLFARGVIAILTTWPVLRIAISEGWGGPDSAKKRTLMASEFVDMFDPAVASTVPDQETVEDLLLQVMVEEFECEVDDGSSPGVAKSIVDLWKAIGAGEGQAIVDTLEARATKAKGTAVSVQRAADEDGDEDDEDGDSGDDDDMEVDEEGDEVPTLQPREPVSKEPEVDEDGFTMVKGKGRR